MAGRNEDEVNLPDFINKLKVATGDEAIRLVEMLQDGKVSGLPVSPLDTLDRDTSRSLLREWIYELAPLESCDPEKWSHGPIARDYARLARNTYHFLDTDKPS